MPWIAVKGYWAEYGGLDYAECDGQI